jgi:hypothetical protein
MRRVVCALGLFVVPLSPGWAATDFFKLPLESRRATYINWQRHPQPVTVMVDALSKEPVSGLKWEIMRALRRMPSEERDRLLIRLHRQRPDRFSGEDLASTTLFPSAATQRVLFSIADATYKQFSTVPKGVRAFRPGPRVSGIPDRQLPPDNRWKVAEQMRDRLVGLVRALASTNDPKVIARLRSRYKDYEDLERDIREGQRLARSPR